MLFRSRSFEPTPPTVLAGACLLVAIAAQASAASGPAVSKHPEPHPRMAIPAAPPVAPRADEHAPVPAEPPPPPDPSDPLARLYGHKQLGFERGVPLVTVRLMENQKQIQFVTKGRMRLRARGGLEKILDAPAGSAWTIRLARHEPGVVHWSVQVAEMRYADTALLAETRALWESRGFSVRTAITGSLYGITGRVLDTRRQVVFIDAPGSEAQGKEILKRLHRDFGFQASLVSSLESRPHGILEVVDASGAILALAEDLVLVSSPDKAPFLIRQVEHAVGYAWHGREDRTYRGDLAFVVDKAGGISVVNSLPLESYLRGIVPSEIFARAHPEALKAQAVAARGEVLAKLGTHHLTDPYLLCAEQHCQVYTGMSGEAATTDAAIAATRGEVLFSEKAGLVDTVYSAVCGGHTEDNDAVWGGMPDPFLRGRSDMIETPPELAGAIGETELPSFLSHTGKSYCSASSFAKAKKYRWERRFTSAEVDAIAKPFGVGHVRVLAPSKRGSSGRVWVLTISGDDGATQVRGELNIRRLFQNLNSALFRVEAPGAAHPGEWLFVGAGWGHGVGMCQTGAIGRAERGQSYKQILGHYYNGATTVRLYDAQ